MKKIIMLIAALSLVFTACNKEATDTKESPVKKVIALMDGDKDGKVSKEEWKAQFPLKDIDKSGEISKDEMRKHHISVHGDDKMFDGKFTMTDKDANGSVTMKECMAKFTRLNTNNDGFLTEDEFMAPMKHVH